MKNMKKTNDPLEEYFMKKFKEMGIQPIPLKKKEKETLTDNRRKLNIILHVLAPEDYFLP